MTLKPATKFFWLGVLLMALGVFVLFNAVMASTAIVAVTGSFLLLGGILQIVLGFWSEDTGGRLMTWGMGALTAFLGWSFMANPLAGIISLSTLLLVLLAASGVVQVVYAMRVRGTRFFAPLLIAGLVTLVLAIVLLASPAATMTLLGALMGLQLLSAGASLTLMGLFLKESSV